MAKRTARRKTRTKRAGGRAARPKRKVRRAAPKRATAKKAAARAPKPVAAPPRPTFGGPTVGGIGTPGPMTPPGDATRRETPWGSRPHSEAEEEFGREDDDEPM